MRKYLQCIWKQFSSMKWYEQSLFYLFIVRCICYLLPETPYPTIPSMTIQAVGWFIVLAVIELNIVYICYRKYTNEFTKITLFIAFGHLIDMFTKAIIKASLGEVVWIVVVVIYIYITWKKKM